MNLKREMENAELLLALTQTCIKKLEFLRVMG